MVWIWLDLSGSLLWASPSGFLQLLYQGPVRCGGIGYEEGLAALHGLLNSVSKTAPTVCRTRTLNYSERFILTGRFRPSATVSFMGCNAVQAITCLTATPPACSASTFGTIPVDIPVTVMHSCLAKLSERHRLEPLYQLYRHLLILSRYY